LYAYYITHCVKVNLFARNRTHGDGGRICQTREIAHMSTDARPDTSATPGARIDQWLWSVRLAKTRADAAAACRAGHVRINGKTAKPSSRVTLGDTVEARLAQRQRIVEVARVIVKRVGASVAGECFVDHSPPPPERPPEIAFAERDRGAGRPTKRDRRRIDRLRGR
jgi:ribosome-associated heat shock protein Hsp15